VVGFTGQRVVLVLGQRRHRKPFAPFAPWVGSQTGHEAT
jgi:hypothetical protein